MTVSNSFFTLLVHFEGFESCPYTDQVGIPTIGIGTTFYPGGQKVSMQDPCISQQTAQTYVQSYITPQEQRVSGLLPTLNQNQFDALMSFIYNIGDAFYKSTLLKKALINVNDPTIADEFKKWDLAGGHVLSDLVERRKEESALYFKPVS